MGGGWVWWLVATLSGPDQLTRHKGGNRCVYSMNVRSRSVPKFLNYCLGRCLYRSLTTCLTFVTDEEQN